MTLFKALYFDGKTSGAQAVTAKLQANGTLELSLPNTDPRIFKAGEFTVDFPVGQLPIHINISDGSSLEVPFDGPLHKVLLDQSSYLKKFIRLSEEKLRYLFLALILSSVLALIIYWYGLPLLANLIQPMLTQEQKVTIGNSVLDAVEKVYFEKSNLNSTEQEKLGESSTEFIKQAKLPFNIKVLIRGGGPLGANAVAIFPEYIVITDELIKKVSSDQLNAIIAHEIGHLELKHGEIGLIRAALSSFMIMFAFGGDPGMLQSVALGILESSYSREEETAADLYAAKLLMRVNQQPELLAEALSSISSIDDESTLEKYLSSHPLTSERIQKIRDYKSNH